MSPNSPLAFLALGFWPAISRASASLSTKATLETCRWLSTRCGAQHGSIGCRSPGWQQETQNFYSCPEPGLMAFLQTLIRVVGSLENPKPRTVFSTQDPPMASALTHAAQAPRHSPRCLRWRRPPAHPAPWSWVKAIYEISLCAG